MEKSIAKLRNNKCIQVRARTLSMTFGYHGDAVTHLHSNFQHELKPASILLYCKPLMKLCADLCGRGPRWSITPDLIAPLTQARVDETALRRNLSQLINNTSAVKALRELTADFASDMATELGGGGEVAVLIDLTTLFLSVLDGNAKITSVIRDNLICDAAAFAR